MQMLDFFKKSAFINAAGIIAVVLAISYNLGKVLELVSTKNNIAKIEGKSNGMADSKSINAFASIVEKNPFGIKGARFSVIRKETAETPADTEGLVLKGVITYRPGFAFIENKDATQRLFKLGEDVFGAGKLTAVYADKASISQHGSVVELRFPAIETMTSKTSAGLPMQGQPRKSRKEMTFDREQIKKFLENPNELLTGARLLPVLKNGRQEGFLVKEIRPGGFYDNMGLKNEDIILRANSIELNSPGDGVKIFNMVKELDRMELDIIRNGVPMTQVFHIN
jgi:general secretion pathway protein C